MWIKTPEQRQVFFAIALGSAAQVGLIKTHLPVISNRLTPVTSHLEGVGNYLAACAAFTLVHCTPPPFIGIILPCIYPSVKLLMNIRSELLSFMLGESASQAVPTRFLRFVGL